MSVSPFLITSEKMIEISQYNVNKLRSVYILKYLFAEFQFFGAQFF